MNVTEAIDQILGRTENNDMPTADYTERRLRLLELLREIVTEIWWLRDWVWKRKRATLTVPAGAAKVVVPADYGSVGVFGGLFYTGDGSRMTLVPESEIDDSRVAGERTDAPTKWAMFDMDTDGESPTYREFIQIPQNDGAVSLTFHYNRRPPELDEDENVENLRMIPEDFHQLVIIPGLRMKARESMGDARFQTSALEYEKAKRFMLSEDSRFQGQPRRLPSFFGR